MWRRHLRLLWRRAASVCTGAARVQPASRAMAAAAAVCCGGRAAGRGAVTAARRRVVAVNRSSATPEYVDNRVSNTKYTALTFLPKNLVEQFSAPMNLYFLMIAFLQLWPAITPVNPITTWAPLLAVTAISAVREAVDDARRARADAAANGRAFLTCVDGGPPTQRTAATIRPGDLVAVPDGVEVPCDLLLLHVGAPANAGAAFVETANLDGETDLKTRQARAETQALAAPAALCSLTGEIVCEPPNADLYRLDATLTLSGGGGGGSGGGGGGPLPISGMQLGQHGTVLRKSGGVWGVALYTGGDTKLSQNKAPPPTKTARMDGMINRLVVVIFLAQLALVAAFGIAGHLSSGAGDARMWYLRWPGGATVVHGDHMDVLPAPLDVDNEEWAGGSGGGEWNHTEPAFSLRGGGGGVGGIGMARLPPGVVASRAIAAAAAAAVAAQAAAAQGAAVVVAAPWYTPLVLPLRFLLLSSMMVPISLKVSLDLIKLYYARLIASDHRMYDAASNAYARAATTAIVEDLGAAEYVLADKTGTLTENVMVLQSLAAGPRCFAVPGGEGDGGGSGGDGGGGDGGVGGGTASHSGAHHDDAAAAPLPLPTSLYAAHGELRTALAHGDWRAAEVCRVLALCNTVSPEYLDARAVPPPHDHVPSSLVPPLAVAAARLRALQYTSSSPDEEALVHGAARLGVALAYRRRDEDGTHKVTVVQHPHGGGGAPPHMSPADVAGKRVWVSDGDPATTYVVLHVLEFTSDRKCMSVVLRRVDDGRSHEERAGGGGGSAASAASAAAAVRSGAGWGAGYTGVDSDDIVVLTKGADEVVRARLTPAATDGDRATRAAVEHHLGACAGAGLRTLMLAGRTIPAAEYAAWVPVWERAQHQLLDRPGAIAAAAAALERDLVLLGATAIEDKLQGGVPAAVAALRSAGMRVWMVTGDKAETALQVATAARVVDPGVAARFGEAASAAAAASTSPSWRGGGGGGGSVETGAPPTGGPPAPILLLVRATTEDGVEAELRAAVHRLAVARATPPPPQLPLRAVSDGSGDGGADEHEGLLASASGGGSGTNGVAVTAPPRGGAAVLVLDGIAAIRHATSPQHAGLLARVALACDTLIACRCLPSQKAALAALVRRAGHMCVAVGDGGNDVAMIQAAHVGVGVAGREGKQAARAADFTVAQFRFLLPLLLVHGRHSAYRTALVAQYTFYKSMCICFLQMAFNAACAFSGCSLLDTFALTTYNLIYTFAPGVAMVLDADRPAGHLLHVPALYRESQASTWLTPATFAAWCARALLQTGALLVLTMLGVAPGGGGRGGSADQTVVAYTAYSALVAVQLVTVATEMRAVTPLNHGINLAAAGVYVAFLALRDVFPAESSSLGTMATLLPAGAPVAAMVLGVIVCTVPWALARAWQAAATAPAHAPQSQSHHGHHHPPDTFDISTALRRCGAVRRAAAATVRRWCARSRSPLPRGVKVPSSPAAAAASV